jgi:beta-glucosidase
LFERYCRRVLETLGDTVPWYCTINEAAVVATGGYIGRWGFPPNVVDARQWRRAIAGLVEGHQRAVAQVRQVGLRTKVGMALYTCEVDTNAGGRPAAKYAERMNQGIYLDAAADDDFIGVQTYTRFYYRLPRIAAPLTRLALAVRPLERFVAPHLLGLATTTNPAQAASDARTTQMGWEYQPEAAAATVRRIAERYPDKDIIVTEHGVATANDHDRAEFITRGLTALHQLLDDGIRLRGYVHWSLLDNFEWAAGYQMTFGLVGVDRMTQQRTIRPSARLLGEIARTGRLTLREQA